MKIVSEIRNFIKQAIAMEDNPSRTQSLTTSEKKGLPNSEFIFTNNWFSLVKDVWEEFIPQIKPQKILEIGSYEGASTCYLIGKLAQESPIEIHCIDTWEGGVEHKENAFDMASVENRFHHNIKIAIGSVPHNVDLIVHKGLSDFHLAKLLSQQRSNYFDLVYVDGSHQASDVLTDAVLGFKLLKVGGYMFFDDYLWAEDLPYGKDPLRCPKMAIDAFINCNFRKIQIVPALLRQLYVQKIAE